MNARIFALLAALAATACSPEAPPQRPPVERARIGGPFALTDQDGKAVTDASFAGKYRIVYFVYTFCPDVCPLDAQNIGAALKLLEKTDPTLARNIVPIVITVDPARDTPAVMKQFVSAFHPRMVGLTGSPEEIARVAKEYGVYFKRGAGTPDGYMMDHTRQAYLMSPDGKPLALLPQEGPPQGIVDEIKRWAK